MHWLCLFWNWHIRRDEYSQHSSNRGSVNNSRAICSAQVISRSLTNGIQQMSSWLRFIWWPVTQCHRLVLALRACWAYHPSRIKEIVHPKITILNTYSPSCHSKHELLFLFTKRDFTECPSCSCVLIHSMKVDRDQGLPTSKKRTKSTIKHRKSSLMN